MNNCIVTFEYRVMVTAFAILAMFSQSKHKDDIKDGWVSGQFKKVDPFSPENSK